MSITVGSHAPAVELEAWIRGRAPPEKIALEEYRGRWVVLFFYPRDFTFVCPTELRAFADLAPEFEREDAQLLAASTDSFWSHKAWFESAPLLEPVEYPVLADTVHTLSEAFGVLTSDGSAFRGTFIVDPEGIVRHASITDQNVGRSPDETLRVLQALRTGELCPVAWQPGEPTLRIAA
jgi:peroxiredoxin (alkyl hydroperoxide reductase subunit C)